MPLHLLPDVIAGLLVAIGFVVGLVVAYRGGFRAARGLSSGAFDFMTTRLSLDGSRWRPQQTRESDEILKEVLPCEISFRQAGSRITGEGQGENGETWNLEGVAQDRRVWCLIRGRIGAHAKSSAWMLFAEGSDLLCGYAIVWRQGDGAPLVMRELRLERSSEADPLSQTAEFVMPPATKP